MCNTSNSKYMLQEEMREKYFKLQNVQTHNQ